MGDPLQSDPTRRGFVTVLGAAAAALTLPIVAAPRAAMAAGEEAWVPTVKPDDLANGGFRLYRKHGFVLSRVDDKIYALSTTCTHQACDVGPGADAATKGLLVCKCHGGRYDGVGKVVQVPPKDPLPHHKARLNAEGIIEVLPTAKLEGDDPGLPAKPPAAGK